MTKLTIEIDDEVAERLAAAATAQGITPEQLAAQIIAEAFPARRQLGFVGIGHSGRGDLSRRVKELRQKAFVNKTAREA